MIGKKNASIMYVVNTNINVKVAMLPFDKPFGNQSSYNTTRHL